MMVIKKNAPVKKRIVKKGPAKLSLNKKIKEKSAATKVGSKRSVVRKAAAPKKEIIKKRAAAVIIKNALLEHEKIQTAEGLRRSMIQMHNSKKRN
jgi:hypothetical protein